MQTLSIRTDFPSAQASDFSILPSPSTFFSLSNAGNYPSPTFDQYPISATDYHQHFLAPLEESVEENDRSILSSQASSSEGSLAADNRSPSPASSFPSTPTGSPIPQNLAIEATGAKQHVPVLSKLDPAVQFEMFESPQDPSQQFQFDCGGDFSDFPPPPAHHNYPRQPVGFSHASYPVAIPQQAQYFAGGGGGIYAHGVPQVHGQQQFYPQQHSVVPYSVGSLPNGNVAYALPHSAPGPAAIETIHGTYYFVPNVNLAPSPVSPATSLVAHNEPVQLPSPPSVTASSPSEAAVSPAEAALSNPYTGFVQLPNGQTAGVAIAQASAAARSPAATTITVVDGDQKIRLPIGQGKRGSTKRAAKKDQVKKFICPHPGCGRAFARNFNMQSHHKSHLGIREFTCPHCPKKFSRRHDRARHCSAVHDSRVDRDGNIAGGRNSSVSNCSGSPSAASTFGEDYDDSLDEDKNFELVDYAG